MANKKSSIKRIDVIKRNTFRNRQYYSNVNTFLKKFFLSLDEYKKRPNLLTLTRVIKNSSLLESKMDKEIKANILSKNWVAKKKSFLSLIKKKFIALEKYKKEPNIANLNRALLYLII